MQNKDDFIVSLCDFLALSSTHNGMLNKDWIMFDWEESGDYRFDKGISKFRDIIYKELPSESGTIDSKTTLYIRGWLNDIRQFLLNEGYIEIPINTHNWFLTEKGKLMKELGGHKAYQHYRRNEINLIRNQGRINTLLIIATLLAGVIPALTFTIDKIWFNDKPQFYQPKVETRSYMDSGYFDDSGQLPKTNQPNKLISR